MSKKLNFEIPALVLVLVVLAGEFGRNFVVGGSKIHCLDNQEDYERGEWKDYSIGGSGVKYVENSRDIVDVEGVRGKLSGRGLFYFRGHVLNPNMYFIYMGELGDVNGTADGRIFLYLKYYFHNNDSTPSEHVYVRPSLTPNSSSSSDAQDLVKPVQDFTWREELIEIDPEGGNLNRLFVSGRLEIEIGQNGLSEN